ncbi:MAG: hypothetical protein ACK5PF_09695 [bacterium]
MTAKTVTIDHPHAEVIAAYYSGKTLQWKDSDAMGHEGWVDWARGYAPGFYPDCEYRIKPEPLVRWVAVSSNVGCGVMFSRKHDAEAWVNGVMSNDEYRVVRLVEQPE